MRRILAFAMLACLLFAMPAAGGPAERAYKKRDLGKARRLYGDRLRRHPDDQRSRYDLGNVEYRSSDLKSAEEAWRAALRSSDPRVRSRAAHNLGNAQLQSQRYGDAVASYIEALRSEPGNEDSKYNLELALRMLQQQQQQQQKQQQRQSGEQNQQQNQQQQQLQRQEQQKGGESRQSQNKPERQAQENSKAQPLPGEYTREQAERVLDGLKQEEQELLADRLRNKGTDLNVEKDW